jgi:hypothetical protein
VKIRTAIAAFVVAAIIGGLIWSWMVISYEPEPTTENTFVGSDANSSVSASTDDGLVSIEIDSGEDILGWDQISISLTVNGTEYPCSLTGFSSVEQNQSKVTTRLNADGSTFSIEIDATSEDTFVGLDFSLMKEDSNDSHSIEFSKSDVFLGSNTTGMVVTDQSFDEIDTVPNGTFDLDDSELLDWYDYDIAVHRVNPKEQIYLIHEGNTTYKLQFISYYDEADESRHIQLSVAWLAGDAIPVFDDPNLIGESPCIIEGAGESWALHQVVLIRENGIDICHQACTIELKVQYQGFNVEGQTKVEVA